MPLFGRRHHHRSHPNNDFEYSSTSAPYNHNNRGHGHDDYGHNTHHGQHRRNNGGHYKDPDHVAGGYRAALANPHTTHEGREQARHELHSMGRSARVPLMTRIKRTLGIRSTPRRRVKYDSPVVSRRAEYAPYH